MYCSYDHPAGIEPKESETLLVGFTTPDAEAEGPPLVGSTEALVTVVTTKDVATKLTERVVEAIESRH